jgi:hypothetical protein
MSISVASRAASPSIGLKALQDSVSRPAAATVSLRALSAQPANRTSPQLPLAVSTASRVARTPIQAPTSLVFQSVKSSGLNSSRGADALSLHQEPAPIRSKGGADHFNEFLFQPGNSSLPGAGNSRWNNADSGQIARFESRLLRNDSGQIKLYGDWESADFAAWEQAQDLGVPVAAYDSNRVPNPLNSNADSIFVLLPKNEFNMDLQIPRQFEELSTYNPGELYPGMF